MDLRFSQFEIITSAGTGILCLFFVCVFSEVPAIENTISMRVNEAVAGPDLYWSSAEVSGQRVTLTGTAPDVPAKRERAFWFPHHVPQPELPSKEELKLWREGEWHPRPECRPSHPDFKGPPLPAGYKQLYTWKGTTLDTKQGTLEQQRAVYGLEDIPRDHVVTAEHMGQGIPPSQAYRALDA